MTDLKKEGAASQPVISIDSLAPAAIERKAESIGVTKNALTLSRLIPLALAAGFFIGLGGLYFTLFMAVLRGAAFCGSPDVLAWPCSRDHLRRGALYGKLLDDWGSCLEEDSRGRHAEELDLGLDIQFGRRSDSGDTRLPL